MTYSIVAVDPKTRTLGVGVASGSIAVGSRVPWAMEGVGAIATQAYTNIKYGVEGLRLLRAGLDPESVLSKLLSEDEGREYRQVAIIDIRNRKAVHTGSLCPKWRGEYVGEDYVIIGNYIVGPMVIESARREMENRELGLAERLLRALVAGETAGGDVRGNRSAALIVVGRERVALRVDDARNPATILLRRFLEHRI